MDAYLADIEDQMEEVEVRLPEKVIVYHTLKNLKSHYDMLKQVILHERRSPSYLELEARLLNEKMTRKNCSHDQSSKPKPSPFHSVVVSLGAPSHAGDRIREDARTSLTGQAVRQSSTTKHEPPTTWRNP